MLKLDSIPFKQAKQFTAANPGRHVQYIVLHSMEAPEKGTTAEAVAKYFSTLTRKASAHYCLTPNTRVLTDRLIWKPLGEIKDGDVLLGVDEYADGMGGRTLQESQVLKIKRRVAPCLRITMSDGRTVTCSTDHRWLVKKLNSNGWDWIASEELQEGRIIMTPLNPWSKRKDRDMGYIAGILDGEGCWHTGSTSTVAFAQKSGAVLNKSLRILDKEGINYTVNNVRDNGVSVVRLSGIQSLLSLLGQARPVRIMKGKKWLDRSIRSRLYSNQLTIDEIEFIGNREVVSIETSTHTFFAEGMVSHNCVDNDSIIQCVQLKDVAYGAANANRNGIHIELAGYAKQATADWQDSYSKAMLLKAAELSAALCQRYGIPIIFRKASDLLAGKTNTAIRGFTTHAEVNKAFGGTHWDPGPGFPMEWFLERVRAAGAAVQGAKPTDGAPSLWIDGEKAPVSLALEEGEGWVSAKELLEHLGYTVSWEGSNKKIIAVKQ